MKLVIEVEDNIDEAVRLISWIRGRKMNSEGEVVRIGYKDRTRAPQEFASRIMGLTVEFEA